MDPTIAIFGIFLVLGTIAFAVGAIYVGGGRDAVTRQFSRIALLAGGLVAVALIATLLAIQLQGLAGVLVLLLLNVGVVALLLRQIQGSQGDSQVAPWRTTLRRPAFRTLVAAWGAALLVAGILLFIATRQTSS